MTDEKAEEYMQVAGLVCLDLDILLDLAELPDMTKEKLIGQIRLAHQMKEEAIHDAEERKERYEACCLVFGAAAAGLVQNTKITGAP